MKIGVYGGTFDPIHIAHLILAEYVREALKLDKVIFMPAARPPHKQLSHITAPELRWQMLTMALKTNPYFEASRLEIDKPEISYIVDTIKELSEQLGLNRTQLYLVIGADSLLDLPTWKQPDQIFQLCHVVVFPRSGFDINQAEKRFLKQIIYVPTPVMEISSSNIRDRVRQGLSIKYLVPPAVEEFIRKKGLYRD